MKHEIEVTVDGQPSLLTALERLDDNEPNLVVYDIFLGEIVMGTVFPTVNEYTGEIEWKSDSEIPVDVVKQIGEFIEPEDDKY